MIVYQTLHIRERERETERESYKNAHEKHIFMLPLKLECRGQVTLVCQKLGHLKSCSTLSENVSKIDQISKHEECS